MLACEQHVECRLNRHQTKDALRAACTRKKAEHHLGKAELRLRIIARHACMTGERNFKSATQCSTVDRRDHGHAERLNAIHCALAGTRQIRGLLLGAHGLEHRDVGTRNEAALLARREDDSLARAVLFDLGEGLLELVREARLECVHGLIRHVHAEHKDAVVALLNRECVG